MAWYWWILLGVLGLNVFVIALVALFYVLDSLRAKRERSAREEDVGKRETAGQSR